MKTKTFTVTLLTVVLTAGLLQAEEQPAEEFSNTRYAEVKLRITTDPKLFPIGEEGNDISRLTYLMFNQDVLGSVWQEILGTSDRDECLEVPILEMPREIGGLQTARIRLSISLSDKQKPAAKEFLEAYLEKLKAAIAKEYDFACSFYIEKLQRYAVRKDQVEMNLRNLLEAQGNLSGGSGKLDKESVRQRILEHEKAKIENDMQQAMLRKRAEELVKQIDEAHRTTDEISAIRAAIQELHEKQDHLSTEYKKIDSERAQLEIESIRNEAEVDMTTKKLSEFEHNFNQAEREIDRLSEHKQQLESQTAGDIQELNRHLRETNIRLEELEIQQRILYGYSPGDISDSIEYEMLEVRIEAAKENLRRAILDKDEAALQYDLLQPPKISYDEIISSETIPEND